MLKFQHTVSVIWICLVKVLPSFCSVVLPTPSLLVWSRLPLPPAWGSHCVFITIKESPACPAIRPHYSAPHLLTLVPLRSVIWPEPAQDFLVGGFPPVSWGKNAHIHSVPRLHWGSLVEIRLRQHWLVLMTYPPCPRPIATHQVCSQFWEGILHSGWGNLELCAIE